MTGSKLTKVTAEPGKHEVLITRVFDAPRDLVFKTYTDPNLVPKWWGPRSVTTTVERMEVRLGGVWRFIHSDGGGIEYAFHGVYHEVLAPERIISTFEFEPMPGHVALETARFEEGNGKTKLTVRSVFQTIEDRDGMINSGMEGGMTESHDRFAELLVEIQKKLRA